LLTNINLIHRKIVFTKELETNNCLHFLDVLIEKSSTGFITSTYRKPHIQVSTQNGRVSFRCTGNETLSTLSSAALMTLPVPTSSCTWTLWIPNVILQRVPQQFFGLFYSAIRKQKTRWHTTTWLTGWTLSFTQIYFISTTIFGFSI